MIFAWIEDYERGWYTEVGRFGGQQDKWSNESENVQIVMLSGTLKQPSGIMAFASFSWDLFFHEGRGRTKS